RLTNGSVRWSTFFFQAEDGIRDATVTGVQTCALPIFGRIWQVNIQADPRFRDQVPDIRQLQVRNSQGQMIRLGTVLDVRDTSGPVSLMRYNMYAATALTGNTSAGTSSGQRVALLQKLAGQELPRSM